MSTIQVNEILSRDGTKTLMKLDSGAMSGVNFGRRNLIINGDMRIAQRGTSQTSVTGGVYLLDRWKYAEGTDGVVTMSQSTDAPDTFKNSLKIEVTTADTDLSGGTQYGNIGTRLEGQDLQHLAYGTSDAKSVTLSFWVKSSNTGTYASELEHGTTGVNVQTWTIDSADTWEYKTVTFEGWTSSALPDGTGTGLYVTPVWFAAGDGISGSSFQSGWRALTQTERLPNNIPNLFATVGNTFYITGVQLEVGDVATTFEHRSYGEELALCQRYYTSSFSGMTTVGGSLPSNAGGRIMAFADSTGSSTDRFAFIHTWPVQMRTAPTVTMYGNQWSSGKISVYNGGTNEWTLTRTATGSINGLNSDYLTASGVTSGDMRVAYVTADAEL